MVRARKNMASIKIADNYFLIGGDVSFGYTRVRFATRFLGGIWLNSNAKTSKLSNRRDSHIPSSLESQSNAI